MEVRHIIAYSLLILLVAFAAGLVLWWQYHSHGRTVTRSRRRESDVYAKRLAERERDGG